MPPRRNPGVPVVMLTTLLLTRILAAQNPAADLVLIHGHVLTVDANDSVAQAVAVRHGVIVKVGTDAEVLEFSGNAPGTRVIDLHGHTATPGLIDTHAHIADGGVDETLRHPAFEGRFGG
jgi:predicted amidohydrolase YtcJ